uniref:Uncharacterized protein n=1 Tax=Haptolina ericina TaxID=156174 RepID=A0A7S3AMR9_9EUKA
MMVLCAQKAKACFCISKLFVFLTNLLLIFCFIFFIILAVFGIASGQDSVKEEWAKTTSTCTTSADEMLAQVVTANTTLQLAKIMGANTTVQQITLNEAEAQLSTFSQMCSCMVDTLSKTEPLLGPGMFGLVAVIIGFITMNGLCCTMGCCCYRPDMSLVKVDDAVSKGSSTTKETEMAEA